MVEGPADKQAKAEASDNDENGSREANREELEKRIAEFASDIRANVVNAEKKRRAATPLEARARATNVVPPQSRGPDRIEEVKVVFAPGLDPRHEPTLVGKRDERRNRWDFVADGDMIDAEHSSELQAMPLPIEQSKPETKNGRKRSVFVVFALTTGVLLVAALFWFQQHEPTQLVLPTNTSERPKVPAPLESPQSAERIETPPAPSNAVPEFPTENELVPDQPKAQQTPMRRGGGKSAVGVKERGRVVLGGEVPEYQ